MRAPLIASIALACASAPASQAPVPAPANATTAQFDHFWATFDREYSYFEYKRVNWDSLRMEFRPRAAATGSTAELVPVLREMLAPLRDIHAWFVTPNGATEPSFRSAHKRNWSRDLWLTTVRACGYTQLKPNLGYCRMESTAYVTIGGWNAAQLTIPDLDSVVTAVRDAPALIVDVRSNGGGSDALALAFAARIATRRTLAAYVRFRSGPRHNQLGRETARYVEPRGPFQFTGPVIVLSGRGVFSSNETFIAAMRELPNVTILGDTTGGGTGNPGFHDLGDGWRFAVPRWVEWTADRRVIEWQGIPPDVYVPWDSAKVAAGQDPVLAAALARLAAR